MLGDRPLVILILLPIGARPRWGYSTGWGHYPRGGVGLVVLIIIISPALAPRIHLDAADGRIQRSLIASTIATQHGVIQSKAAP